MSGGGAPAVTDVSPDGYNGGEMTDDATLVHATLQGSERAFATLVDRHARVCLRYATRMLGNVQDAEDASQEAFVRAHRALARFDGRVTFRTWLMTILINRCRSLLDARRRTVGRTETLTDATPATSPAEDGAVALRDAINRALARLDEQQREAFLLRHVEEMGYADMSVATGAGVSALKMRVTRACARLQEMLEDERRD